MTSVLPYEFDEDVFRCVSEDWLPSKKFPGETCSNGDECISSLCLKNRCKGLGAGMTCMSHDYCDVGMICLNSICQMQRAAGEPCQNDDECTNDSLCFNDVCALLFSVPSNSQFNQVSNNAVYLCESGYLYGSKCLPAPSNKNPPDFNCYSPTDCQIVFPDHHLDVGRCYCGFNPQGLSYCQAQPGDVEFQKFKTNLQSILSTVNMCHFSISLSMRCPELAALQQYEEFLNSYYVYYYRHGIIGLPDCLKSIMPFSQTYDYSNYDTQRGGSGGSDKTVVIVVVVVVFTVIMAAGLVCCLCVRKCATDERNQEIIRQRFLQEDMEEVPVRIGRTIHQSDPPILTPVYEAQTIILDPKNKRFLRTGIPLALCVDPSTFEPEVEEELREDRRWVHQSHLAATIEDERTDMQRDNSQEEIQLPARMPEKSRPGTSSTS